MYEVTINHKAGKRVYPVYTQEEAKKEGIKYVYWKHAQVGDYGCSDDGRIAECYSRERLRENNRERDYIKFGSGVTWSSSPQFVVKGRQSVHIASKRSEMEREMSKKATKALVNMVARRVPILKAIDEVVAPETLSQRDRWLRVTNTKEFQMAVQNEKVRMLEKQGITDEKLAEEWDKLKQDVESASADQVALLEQFKLRRGILQDLSNYKGWSREDKVKLKQEQIEGVFDTKMLGEILQIKGESKEAEGTVEQLTQSAKSDES